MTALTHECTAIFVTGCVQRRYMDNVVKAARLPIEFIDDGVEVVVIRIQPHHKGVQRVKRKLVRFGLVRAPGAGAGCVG